MKTLKILFISIIVFASCESAVVFQDAMPPGVEAITEVPELFHGVYVCESDSSRIYIEKYDAVQESFYEFVTSIMRVRETEDCSIVAGGLYLPGRKECIPFEYINEDSISAKVYELDTLFSFQNDEIAKFYNGHLFLNKQNEEQNWITRMLTPQQGGSLILELITVPDNKRKVEEITIDYSTREIKKDNIQYIINPTLVEFERILDKEYTLECDILHPVNLEITPFKKAF